MAGAGQRRGAARARGATAPVGAGSPGPALLPVPLRPAPRLAPGGNGQRRDREPGRGASRRLSRQPRRGWRDRDVGGGAGGSALRLPGRGAGLPGGPRFRARAAGHVPGAGAGGGGQPPGHPGATGLGQMTLPGPAPVNHGSTGSRSCCVPGARPGPGALVDLGLRTHHGHRAHPHSAEPTAVWGDRPCCGSSSGPGVMVRVLCWVHAHPAVGGGDAHPTHTPQQGPAACTHVCAHTLQHSTATQCTQTLHGAGARPHTHVCAHTQPLCHGSAARVHPSTAHVCTPAQHSRVRAHTHTPHSSAQPHTHTLTHLHGIGAHTRTHTRVQSTAWRCAPTPHGGSPELHPPLLCAHKHALCRAPSHCACTTRTPFAHVPARPMPGTRCPT